MLFPLLPRSPHLFANDTSSTGVERPKVFVPEASSLFACGIGPKVAVPPPKIDATDEWAQRACLRIAEVTVMHSVVMRATGSIATDMGNGWSPPVGLSNGGGILLQVFTSELELYIHTYTLGN